MNKPENLPSLNDSVQNTIISNLSDINIDLADNVINLLIGDDSIIQNIPVLKYWSLIYKTIKSTSDYLLMRKMILFLNEIKPSDIEKRKKFIKKMNRSKKLVSRIGDFTIAILDKSEEEKKAILYGHIYQKMIENELDESDGLRMCFIIQKMFYSDIIEFCFEPDSAKQMHYRDLYNSLSGTGLTIPSENCTNVIYDFTQYDDDSDLVSIKISPFGNTFRKILLPKINSFL